MTGARLAGHMLIEGRAAARSTPSSRCASPAAWAPPACSRSIEEPAMDLNFTPARRSLPQPKCAPSWPTSCRCACPIKSPKASILEKADMEEWHATLNERGWLANHWPEQYGGPGWTAVEKFIFETRMRHRPSRRASCPSASTCSARC
jgi:hypothetical protein